MAIPFRHALVTGGGSGVGRSVALSLAAAGVDVTVCGRRPEALAEVCALDARIHGVAADISDEASVASLYSEATAARGAFDVVIVNAGMAESAPASRTSLDMWQRTLAVNLTGAFLTVRPAIEPMKRAGAGRIVFVASIAGLKGAPYVAAYVASKHGVIGLMRALAAELAATGITVNAVCPGFVETPMLERTVANIVAKTGRDEAAARQELARGNPQGRFVQPDEVAETVLWLCSDGARSVTAQAISISGGETW